MKLFQYSGTLVLSLGFAMLIAATLANQSAETARTKQPVVVEVFEPWVFSISEDR